VFELESLAFEELSLSFINGRGAAQTFRPAPADRNRCASPGRAAALANPFFLIERLTCLQADPKESYESLNPYSHPS
jgi:hypothetical protein